MSDFNCHPCPCPDPVNINHTQSDANIGPNELLTPSVKWRISFKHILLLLAVLLVLLAGAIFLISTLLPVMEHSSAGHLNQTATVEAQARIDKPKPTLKNITAVCLNKKSRSAADKNKLS